MNTSSKEFSKISTNIADVLVKLHKAGGLSLVFLFIGISLVIFANIAGEFRVATFSLGVILLVFSFGIFAFLHLKGPVKAIQTLRENEQTIDSLQQLALELVANANTVQAFALRYATEFSEVIDKSLPVLRLIPGIGSKVKELKLDKVQHLARTVVGVTSNAEEIIRDTEKALKNADFTVLKKYASQLRGTRESVKKMIAGFDNNPS